MGMKDGLKAVMRPGLPVLNRVDSLVRTLNGRARLPPFSLRTRTDSWRYTFGGARWIQKGGQIVGEVKTFCALEPTEDVLEIGCGCGIAALPLKSFLTSGTYTGLDVMSDVIEWCRTHLGDARFRFVHLDVHSELYNPRGSQQSNQVTLPVPDASFDVVFLISVLTHLPPDAVGHYLGEIRRVLRPGGRCLATMLTTERYRPGLSRIPLKHAISAECLSWDAVTPSKAYAFSSGLVTRLVAAAGLHLRTMAPGSWDGVTQAPYAHDMYVFERP